MLLFTTISMSMAHGKCSARCLQLVPSASALYSKYDQPEEINLCIVKKINAILGFGKGRLNTF